MIIVLRVVYPVFHLVNVLEIDLMLENGFYEWINKVRENVMQVLVCRRHLHAGS